MNVSERVEVYLFEVKGLRKVFVRGKKARGNLAVFLRLTGFRLKEIRV